MIGAVLVAGCGSGHERPSATETARARASHAADAAPLSVRQLKALTFRDGEVPQVHGGEVPLEPSHAEKGGGRTFPPVSDPACQVVMDTRDAKGSFARISQIFNWKDSIWPGASTLASYEGGKAVAAFGRLQGGLKTCRSYTGTGWVGPFKAELTPEKAPRLGDEAVSYEVAIPMPEDKRLNQYQYTVVRVGSVIVTFSTQDLGRHASFPADLMRKQVERISAAQRKR
ncbi:hypothetical protein [Streptomyces sp. NPDC001816]|uniref:hypothetical protein n=1 Tax=Streptomyces sp. NPDC001816 TaxID=3364612 RepID=UPI003683BB81